MWFLYICVQTYLSFSHKIERYERLVSGPKKKERLVRNTNFPLIHSCSTTRKFLFCDERIRRKNKEFRRKSRLRRNLVAIICRKKRRRKIIFATNLLQKFATGQGFVVSPGRSQPPRCNDVRRNNGQKFLRRSSSVRRKKLQPHDFTDFLFFIFSVFWYLNVLFSNFT